MYIYTASLPSTRDHGVRAVGVTAALLMRHLGGLGSLVEGPKRMEYKSSIVLMKPERLQV